MLTESDRAVLDESYLSCTAGTEAISSIIHKVTDQNLALELNRQACKFVRLSEKTTGKLAKEYETPRGRVGKKAKVWAGMQMNTLSNSSTGHVAELMIRSNADAMTDMMKVLKKNKDAKKEYLELAEEIMDFEEKCIETLKAYLK